MDNFASADAFLAHSAPERPVLAVRPHAAARAARWFLDHFPGEVAYAYKANSSVFLLGALYGAGIRHFDVASIPEIADAATIPKARLHFMHPVKSRVMIAEAYHRYGVRSFALDSLDELEKILTETGHARDLTLWVRLAVPAIGAKMPLDRKYGVTPDQAHALVLATRRVAHELGITFHVGSQTEQPSAYGVALGAVQRLIIEAGVVVDRLDVGGGFPSRYADGEPSPLPAFMDAIRTGLAKVSLPEHCRVMCEPGRALVAEAESLIVRVDARRGDELFINDGSYGTLFDAAHMGWRFPVRLVGRAAAPNAQARAFSFWGPTCDTIDHMAGPFVLPDDIGEGDYIEIGMIGAYGRAIASRFNGYGHYDEVILRDEPMFSLYGAASSPADATVGEAAAVARDDALVAGA
ncbi:MAG: type III PLP-dependent enzyme [Pseudomonadota bacterium]